MDEDVAMSLNAPSDESVESEAVRKRRTLFQLQRDAVPYRINTMLMCSEGIRVFHDGLESFARLYTSVAGVGWEDIFEHHPHLISIPILGHNPESTLPILARFFIRPPIIVSFNMVGFDMQGVTPAPITPFTTSGEVDYDAIQRLGSWLGTFKGVKGLVVLGHAGEGTFLSAEEQGSVIKAFVKSVNDKIPIIAGITGEGTEVAALEAKRAREAGAKAGLLYPSHGWLRFGYQDGAPQDRYRRVYEVSGLPLILFQYPDNTKATYSLKTMLDISAQPGVFAMKNGVRNMRRWDTEIPVIRRERPDLQILSCHDEYLLHTAFDVDGFLVGYGNIAPELLIELVEAGKAKDYKRARAIHDQLLPVTKSVYHRGSHMEGTVALKHALVARGILSHANVRSPLLPLEPGAEDEIHAAVGAAALSKVA